MPSNERLEPPADGAAPGGMEDLLDEEARLHALEALGLLDTLPEERFDRVTALAARLFGVEKAAVTLIDRNRQFTKSAYGYAPADIERRHSFCTIAIQQPDQLVVEDASEDARFADNPSVVGDHRVRFYAGQPLEAPGGHRVGALCIFDSTPRELSASDRVLLRDLGLWVQKEMAIDEELERAADVQRGLLPDSPPSLAGWELAGVCLPTRDVGGDFYDWYATPKGFVVTLGDVMGKGMPAAIMMATLRAVLRAASRFGTVAEAISAASETMDEDFGETGAFATAFHARLLPEPGRVRYVDAGHGLTVLRRSDGRWLRPVADGLPVGTLADATWDIHEVVLEPGDALAVVSDGVLDLHPDLDTALLAMAEALELESAAAAVERIVGPARSHRPDDDCTAVVLRRREDTD